MADEVEITNVGGDSGVASEATLASLTKAIERLAASTGKDPTKEAGKVQKAHNDAVRSGIEIKKKETSAEKEQTEATKEATSATRNFSRTLTGGIAGLLGSLTGSIQGMATALLDGGTTISEFAVHFPFIGGYLGQLTGIIDDSIASFREMSQAGATFGNGLTDIRQIAAQAAMPLGDFVGLVGQNSNAMRLFGTDVASGARNFAAMSRELRQGPGRQLLNLGFTSAELNEHLINYAELQEATFARDRVRGSINAQSAAEFAEELQRLSAISGKRREQIEAEMQGQSADVRMMAATARMTDTEARTFRANLGTVGAASTALSNALLDFDDGIPTDEVTRQFRRMSETFRTQGQDIESMDPLQLQHFLVNVREDLIEEAERMGRPLEEIMNAYPGMADAFNAIGELAGYSEEMTQQQYDELRATMLAEKARSDALKGFEENMNTIRGELMDAFISSGVFGTIVDGFDNAAGVVQSFAEYMGSPAFKEKLDAFIDEVAFFIEEVKALGFKQAISNLFAEGGPFEGAFENISEIVGPFISSSFGTAFGAIGESIKNWIVENMDSILLFGLAGIGALIAAPFLGVFGAIAAGVIALIGWEKIEPILMGAWETITGLFSSMSEWWSELSLSGLFTDAWNGLKAWFGGLFDFDFEMPNFSAYLPRWMGGEGRPLSELFSGGGSSSTPAPASGPEPSAPAPVSASEPSLETNLQVLNDGLDIEGVRDYNRAMQNLVETLRELNEVLSEDNRGTFGGGTGVAAADVLGQISTASTGSSEGINSLNRLMVQMLTVLQEIAEDADKIESNTASSGSNLANGRVSDIR